jgi:hypothetical protein
MRIILMTAAFAALIAITTAHAAVLCPDPNAKCLERDNPNFYKENQIPKKFHGTWVRIDNSNDKSPTKIDAGTINFGSGFKETITNIEPGDEDGTTLTVTYMLTCLTPCPRASPVTWVLRLLKLNGRETLIWVNKDQPAAMMVTQRAR